MTTWSVMTWNILMGGADRFEAIVGLIRRERPDVLVLQECLGWTVDDQLARVAAALEVPANPTHTLLGIARPRPSGARYHVALISRFPIRRGVTHADPSRVGHAVVEAELETPGGGVLVLGTHFDSHGEDQRLRDAAMLLEVAEKAPVDARILVAGDLNALSRHDPYPDDLDEQHAAAGTQKFGIPARFETMDLLEQHAFVDLLWVSGTPSRWVTAVRENQKKRIDYRTDYLLATPRLASDLVSIRVVEVGDVSDHAAVLATFRAD